MRYGDYRDPLPGEPSNDYWERMELHERRHGITPETGAPWPTPPGPRRSPLPLEEPEGPPEPIPLNLFRRLKERGIDVVPCPDGDGRWHHGDGCFSVEGLMERFSAPESPQSGLR